MLRSNKEAPVNAVSGKIESLIGTGTEMRGELKGTGNIRIDGFFEGRIKSEGSLYVGKNGQVCGDVQVQNIVIGGKVNGNVEARNKLEILSGGQLFGDIRARQLVIAEGVIFEGSCDMGVGTKRVKPVEVVCDEKIEYDFAKKKIELKKVPFIKAE